MKSDYNKPASEGWSREYEKGWLKANGKPCEVCDTKGYLEDKDKHGKIIKTTCIICGGSGYEK